MPPPTTTTNLRYKTFDQLMASVESDLEKFADEGFIVRPKFIKVIRDVNADLGLKLNSERETMLEVRDYETLLPEDFMFLQLALATHVSYVRVPTIGGAHTEAHTIEKTVPNRACSLHSCDSGSCNGPCNNCTWITQTIGIKTFTFTDLKPLSLSRGSLGKCSDGCMNLQFRSPHQIHIREDHANFSFREGKVYINYLADMMDDDNNIILLDHPIVNDYYEYAVKERFFENMMINKEGDFINIVKLMNEKKREARTRAINFINVPEFGEIQKMYMDNRHRFYKKYIKYFNDSNQGYFKDEPSSTRNYWRDYERHLGTSGMF